jgi:hypothetical protein
VVDMVPRRGTPRRPAGRAEEDLQVGVPGIQRPSALPGICNSITDPRLISFVIAQ